MTQEKTFDEIKKSYIEELQIYSDFDFKIANNFVNRCIALGRDEMRKEWFEWLENIHNLKDLQESYFLKLGELGKLQSKGDKK